MNASTRRVTCELYRRAALRLVILLVVFLPAICLFHTFPDPARAKRPAAASLRTQGARPGEAVVQSNEADAREYNGAFVAMQYYGYLRRAPEQSGYED